MKKLLAIQLELKVSKEQRNEFGKYKYRSCEDILENVKPLLEKNNCSLILSDEIIVLGEGEPKEYKTIDAKGNEITKFYGGQRFYIKATATLRDLDTDDVIIVNGYAREEEDKKGMDGSQVTGASSSYARKYALNGMFAIDDTKDSDSTNTYGKQVKERKPFGETQYQTFEGEYKKHIGKYPTAESMIKMLDTQYILDNLYKHKIIEFYKTIS